MTSNETTQAKQIIESVMRQVSGKTLHLLIDRKVVYEKYAHDRIVTQVQLRKKEAKMPTIKRPTQTDYNKKMKDALKPKELSVDDLFHEINGRINLIEREIAEGGGLSMAQAVTVENEIRYLRQALAQLTDLWPTEDDE